MHQLERVTSLLPQCGFQELKSYHQAVQQVPSLAEPSHWTLFLIFLILSYVLEFSVVVFIPGPQLPSCSLWFMHSSSTQGLHDRSGP